MREDFAEVLPLSLRCPKFGFTFIPRHKINIPAITRPAWRTSTAIKFCCELTTASACRIYHPNVSVLGNTVDCRHITFGSGVGDQLTVGRPAWVILAAPCRSYLSDLTVKVYGENV